MQLPAAVSNAVAGLVGGPTRPARLLGVSPAAIYLAVGGLFIHSGGTDAPKTPVPATGMNEKSDEGVVAVLAHDAVRLPCGVVLPTTSAELPLTAIGPDAGAELLVGDGRVSWSRPDRQASVVIDIVREWPVSRVGRGDPVPAAAGTARAALPADIGLVATGLLPAGHAAGGAATAGAAGGPRADEPQTAALRLPQPLRGEAVDAFVRGLLGRGPGLTPAGDDVLAGLLAGCVAFGVESSSLRAAISALAPARTTALSAALLGHAARGECIAEVAALAAALTGTAAVAPAMARLVNVGHTSGPALALGLLLAADGAEADAAVPQARAAVPVGAAVAAGIG